MSARSVFYVGKGGVGKSTLAALAALAHNADGRRVLLLSLDPAHNQSDIFEQQFGESPRSVRTALDVIEPDLDHWIRRYLVEIEDRVRASYTYLTALNLEHHFRVLRHSPGLEEFALRRIYEHTLAENRETDILIVDMPPTALAVRFFSSPSLSLAWTKQLLDLRREITRRREMITRIRVGGKEIEQDRIMRTLERETKHNENLTALFGDPERCAVHLVINPDPLSWKEGMRIRAELNGLGIATTQVDINKSVDRDFLTQKLPASLADLPQLAIPLQRQSPIGIDLLKELLGRIDTNALRYPYASHDETS